MNQQPAPAFDKLYWLRVGLAAFSAVSADVLVGTDYATGISIAIGIYLASYYLARFIWYRDLGKEFQGKIYSMGIGAFVLVFIYTWMFVFTLQSVGFLG
jgi:hypothetical protein